MGATESETALAYSRSDLRSELSRLRAIVRSAYEEGYAHGEAFRRESFWGADLDLCWERSAAKLALDGATLADDGLR